MRASLQNLQSHAHHTRYGFNFLAFPSIEKQEKRKSSAAPSFGVFVSFLFCFRRRHARVRGSKFRSSHGCGGDAPAANGSGSLPVRPLKSVALNFSARSSARTYKYIISSRFGRVYFHVLKIIKRRHFSLCGFTAEVISVSWELQFSEHLVHGAEKLDSISVFTSAILSRFSRSFHGPHQHSDIFLVPAQGTKYFPRSGPLETFFARF